MGCRSGKRSQFGWILFCVPWIVACSPTYAPPPRAGLGGAPATPSTGNATVGAAAFVTQLPFGETGDLSVGVSDWVQVEAGAWGAWVEDNAGVLLGYVGARVNPLAGLEKQRKIQLTSDVELGGGAGVGGRNCADRDLDACYVEGLSDRFAGGGYLGGSVGMRVSWFDLYLRARLQLSGAKDVPPTFWYTGLLGVQFRIAALRLFGGGGYIGYENREDGGGSFLVELGFSVLFSAEKGNGKR